jgi:AraC-like DNA-binding protein
VDVLTDVLSALRLRSSLYCRSELGAPWGLHFLPMTSAVFHVLYHGGGFLCLPGETTLRPLAEGDVVMLPRGEAHTLLSTPDAPLFRDLRLDQWGECALMRWSDQPTSVVLCGACEVEQQSGHPLLALLPRVIHIPQGESGPLAGILSLMASEAESTRPGKELVLRRLADILFIQILRHWVATQGATTRGWLAALRDEQIGQALGLIHHDPAHPWTVEALASAVALSRAAFAARFTRLVGEPPLHYLTGWRMRTAAQLLQEQRLGVAEVAQRVGYGSEVAFSKAFKRIVGVAPGAYRRGQHT